MAAASPTPLSSYNNGGRMSRQPSMRSSLQYKRESPISILGQSHGFSANAPMMQRIDIGDSSEDEIEQPMKLNPYTRALLGQDNPSSPVRQQGAPKLRISRNSLGHTDTPMQDTITPAPSLRIKRVPLRGAPMRRLRRTPQSEDEQQPQQSSMDVSHSASPQAGGSPQPLGAGSPRIVRITSPSHDQENYPASTMKADSVMRVNSNTKVDSMMKDSFMKDSVMKVEPALMDIGESDLARLLRMKIDPEDAALDLSFTRYYWKEMLECVSSVHEYDIVHSDLKPANFLLIQGRLKLIDFGIANAIDIDNTVNVHRDSHVGTPNYMSPESLQDSNASARHGPNGDSSLGRCMKLGKPSDVWSLGCILYQMVYGRPPFAHIPNQIHRVMAIVNPNVTIDFPSHGLGNVRVPTGLKKTLKRCLQRDPSRRPTIPEMLSERDEFLCPDAGDDLKIPEALLGQIIQRVADRFRDQSKPMPTEEEIRQYPGSFYAKIRDLLEEV
ncbi:Checkpoint protein kinase [Neofusicoccum parvum]|uniref:Checkpoint protein kinase n=1 Tax=Neofusicoccum parvum TaxID=310453 RepID=A0ACB5RXM8_9PEZI|nr:Checkpoint protein kinase [Neofusicoccum parvum]GME54709.1 Checkpoint protein kinase [Neofusicoccum parvum]